MLTPVGNVGRTASRPPFLPEIVQLAARRLGIDFRTKGPRRPPTKRVGTDALPSGAYIENALVRLQANASVVFDGWDFSGYALYVDQGTVALIDCRLPNATGPSLDVRNTASVTADWCDFDGLKSKTNVFTQVTKANSAFLIIRDSSIHASGVDLIALASNFTLQRCYFGDGGYNPDEIYHWDGAQLVTAAGTYQNIVIQDCLGDGQGPREMTNLLRLVTDNGGTLDNVLIEGNVLSRPTGNPVNTLLDIGPIGTGGAATNVRIRNNWLRYGTADPTYPKSAPGGVALWENNRNLDSGAAVSPPTGWVAVEPTGNLPVVARPSVFALSSPVNDMGDSTTFGVGAPSGSDPVTQLRALFATVAGSAFNLLGTGTTVTAVNVGQGGVGGENSAQGLVREQYVSANYPAQMARTWGFSFGLNDYLTSVTPNPRSWADNVQANYASMAALLPNGRDYYFKLTPAEQNTSPGQQFSADHVYHRRAMSAAYGWRAVNLTRALRLMRQEEGGVIAGGADEKALANGVIAYSYRGTATYSSIVNGTDYADGDRTPSINAVAPSNTTDLGYDSGSLWYHANGASPAMYRKTGANGAGGWALSDAKHFGRVGYGRIARIDADVIAAIESKGPPFAAPQEFRVALDAAEGAAVGTLSIKGAATAAGIYNLDGSPSTQFSISTAGVVTRAAGAAGDGVSELVVALTNAAGTLHSALDIYWTRATGAAPTLRPLASPGVAVVGRANHGMANTTGFAFVLHGMITALASNPTVLIFQRGTTLGSSPTTPITPLQVTLSAGNVRVTASGSSTTGDMANSLTSSGAGFTAGVPGILYVSVDFTNNTRTIYLADATSERTGTIGAVNAGTLLFADALPTFLMGAAPNQYYDGVTPLVGGVGYIGFWDSYVDWTNAANRRALASVTGVLAARTPYAALPAGPAPKLEMFGAKGDWLYGTPDGSNGPQTLAISHRARSLMS